MLVTNEAAVLNESPSGTAGKPERGGQHRLDALKRVDEEHADRRENSEHAAEVGGPGLRGARVDADEAVDAALDREVSRRV